MEDKILAAFRQIAPEYSDKSDNEVKGLIVAYEDFVSKRTFGQLYEKAVACLVAHFLKIGDMLTAGESCALLGGSVVMEKEGDLQRQYGSNSGGKRSDYEEWLGKTVYGKMFLALRNMCVFPVLTRMG